MNKTQVYLFAPNLLVKHRMMSALGRTYDENEKPNIDDWRTFKNDL